MSRPEYGAIDLGAVAYTGDYIHVYCAKCGEEMEFKYKGLDPAIPYFEVSCGCGEKWEGKWSEFEDSSES